MNRSEELETLYSPSRWSKRYGPEEVIQKHVEFLTKASQKARKYIPCQLSVPYGPSEWEKMDIFGNNLPSDAPIFIYIHGGYWQELNREVSSFVVKPLNKNNFRVIILGYTLCPEATLTQIVKQIQRAISKCVDYAVRHKSRSLYLCGHSAGAHLIASLFESFISSMSLEKQKLFKGMFLMSGVYDLSPLPYTYINDALNLDKKTAKKLSPLYKNFEYKKVVLRDIPIFVVVAEYDTPAFLQQSVAFHEKLKNSNYNSELILVKAVDHFDLMELFNTENYEIVKLIIGMEAKTKKYFRNFKI